VPVDAAPTGRLSDNPVPIACRGSDCRGRRLARRAEPTIGAEETTFMTRTHRLVQVRPGRLAVALSFAALLLVPPSAGARDAEPASAASRLRADGVVAPGGYALGRLAKPGDEVRLSNEVTVTRWANALTLTFVRTQPRGGARAVARLRTLSSSFGTEIYGVLRARMDGQRRIWLRVRVPGRPNGRVGWAPAKAFGRLHVARTRLVINRATLRATFYRNGRRVWQAPVGVGKAGTPTPGGRFFIDRVEGAVLGPVYGTHVLFTNAFSSLPSWPGGGAVGIHGTNQPQLVPGRPSHGCIRMRNRDVDRLARLAREGTPLRIL
jgi:hypothetical protein